MNSKRFSGLRSGRHFSLVPVTITASIMLVSAIDPTTTTMARRGLLKTGILGTAIAAICCFTPALAILLGALGLAAWLAWLDYVLIPALIVFAGLTGYALVTGRRKST